MEPAAARSRWSASPILWSVGILLLVVGAGVLTWRFRPAPAASEPAAMTTTAPARLVAGHDYYLHVKLVELRDHRADGAAWDRVGDSGPDVRFNLTWRKNVIWDAIEKPDTLIGSWDLLKVDLRQVVMSGGQADLENAINAPLVHYQPGETVEMKVWDADPVSSDGAGSVQIKLDDLSPGENTLYPAAGGEEKSELAVKRVVLSLIDRRTTLPELIDTLSKR